MALYWCTINQGWESEMFLVHKTMGKRGKIPTDDFVVFSTNLVHFLVKGVEGLTSTSRKALNFSLKLQ